MSAVRNNVIRMLLVSQFISESVVGDLFTRIFCFCLELIEVFVYICTLPNLISL